MNLSQKSLYKEVYPEEADSDYDKALPIFVPACRQFIILYSSGPNQKQAEISRLIFFPQPYRKKSCSVILVKSADRKLRGGVQK